MNYLEKCESILEWAEEHPNFDTGFVQQMLDILEAGYDLTKRQSAAIDTIVERWRIEV